MSLVRGWIYIATLSWFGAVTIQSPSSRDMWGPCGCCRCYICSRLSLSIFSRALTDEARNQPLPATNPEQSQAPSRAVSTLYIKWALDLVQVHGEEGPLILHPQLTALLGKCRVTFGTPYSEWQHTRKIRKRAVEEFLHEAFVNTGASFRPKNVPHWIRNPDICTEFGGTKLE